MTDSRDTVASARRPLPHVSKESTPVSSTAGRLVTEMLAYDGGRQATAYVPADPPEAIVFAGDGQLITSWGGALWRPLIYHPR